MEQAFLEGLRGFSHVAVPVEVRLLVTDELVGYICSECHEKCSQHGRHC